jgi:arylsulfatase A-like enzyme
MVNIKVTHKFLILLQMKYIITCIMLAFVTLFTSAQSSQPNIVFILVDDMGWGDLGINFQNEKTGKKHFTPELDALSKEGVRMVSHYCPAPICAPSRASLFLGQHQGHADIRDKQFDKALPNQLTIGSAMQMAGYRTAMVGKYGLQGDGDNPKNWPAYPTKRGFSEFFGYPDHVGGHMHYPYHDWPIGDKDKEHHRTSKKLWHQQEEISRQLEGCYTTDLFTAFAKKWITDHRNVSPEQPFMLMLTYDTPHAALQVATGPYPEGKGLSGGVQWLGKPGEMINTAKGEIDSYIHPDYRNDDWTNVEQRFASMNRRIDNAVGDLTQLLRDLNIDENTLVVFTSDNGPHRESYIDGESYAPTSFQSYGPYEGIKGDVWEGGIRVPSFAWWPEKIPAGHVDSNNSQFHDWFSTFVELAGLPRPAICDGINLMPQLSGEASSESSTVYVEFSAKSKTPSYDDFDIPKRNNTHNQMQVIFLDGYKGVRTDIQSHDQDFEIYDVNIDPAERNNLAGSNPTFTQLNQRMKDRVLQLHIANETAPRPYDYVAIPAVTVPDKLQTGLQWKEQKGTSPWVAQLNFESMQCKTKPGRLPQFDPSKLYQAEGLLMIPDDSKVVLHLETNGEVIIKIHDNVVINQDVTKQKSASDSYELNLGKGHHPIRIYAKDMTKNTDFVLSWTINGKRTALKEDSLFSQY